MKKKWYVIKCLEERLEDTLNSIHEVSDLPPMIVNGKPQMFDPTFNIIYFGEKQTESRVASAISNVSHPVTTPNVPVPEPVGAVLKKKPGRKKGWKKHGKDNGSKLTKSDEVLSVEKKEESGDRSKEEVVVKED